MLGRKDVVVVERKGRRKGVERKEGCEILVGSDGEADERK